MSSTIEVIVRPPSLEAFIIHDYVTTGDVPQLQALHEEALPVRYPTAYYEKLVSVPTYQSFLVFTPDTLELVAFITGRTGETNDWFPRMYAYIMTLGVKVAYRQRGIASALLKMLEDFFQKRNVDFMYLDMLVSNRPALSLYAKHGFSIVRSMPNYYSFSWQEGGPVLDHDAYRLEKHFERDPKCCPWLGF